MAFKFMCVFRTFLLLSIVPTSDASKIDCSCGWKLLDGSAQFTNRLYYDFSDYPSLTDLVSNPKAKEFTDQWVINGYSVATSDPQNAHDQQFNSNNVIFQDGYLQLIQMGYSSADATANQAVNIAGIQTRTLDILHGSFRIAFKITGSNGGSVGSFFWYHNNTSEIDIEIVTASDSIVNSTINYTSHPSEYANGTAIPNATLSVPFSPANYTTLQTHRFDCTPQTATYYLNDVYMHQDHHNVPHFPGSLQLNLWADGNRLWSGTPSRTNVTMSVSMIDVYYNTSDTDAGMDQVWLKACEKAGGPSNETMCMEGQTVPIASSGSTGTTSATDSGPAATGVAGGGADAGSSSQQNGAVAAVSYVGDNGRCRWWKAIWFCMPLLLTEGILLLS